MVKKDYQVNVKINAIPIAQIEKIKNLFDEKNLIFYDIKKPLNWTKFL